MAARAGESPLRMVYWYNVAERVPSEELTAPSRNVHTYKWRTLLSRQVSEDDRSLCRLFRSASVGSDSESEVEGETGEGTVVRREADVRGEYKEGDRVVVRPPAARCTTEWTPAVVTDVKSDTNIEVDGIPRHVSDLRPAPDRSEDEPRTTPAPAESQSDYRARLRPRRERHSSPERAAVIPGDSEGSSATEEAEDYRARLRPRPLNPPSYRV